MLTVFSVATQGTFEQFRHLDLGVYSGFLVAFRISLWIYADIRLELTEACASSTHQRLITF